VNTNQISVDQFLRSIALRPGRLGWFLGAGASASSGIPTAWDMIWDFKQQLFVSQRKVPFQEVKDLTQAANRKRIQEHIASSPNMPPLDSPEEYAKLFEAAYPSPTDRREYIDRQIKLGSPSKGHIALAILQRCGFTKRVWTTNFDTVVEDAFTKMGHSTADLIVADIDRANVAQQAISNDRWPLYVKLHGDFRSEALKNTMSELSEQDATLRRLLYEHCCSHGLIIAGYSGRDNSIMDIFEQALTHDKPFPNGLFWLQRKNAELLPRVSSFLASAELKGVECGRYY
jgi:NAD-dependent SIR2 family protein deacetylase